MGLTWEVFTGADGAHYAHQGRYTARVVEGRVWRWQVGDDREPARLSGRTTRGMGEAQEACALAVRLLELSDAGADVEGLPTSSGRSDDWRDGYAAGADASEERIRTDATVKMAMGSLEVALRENADLKDQIGERDGVIAQLRATLKRYTDVYGDPADSDRLTAEYTAELGASVKAEMARIEREAGKIKPGEIKVGDRVLWRLWWGEIAGVVWEVTPTPDGLFCRFRVDGNGGSCGALAHMLEVITDNNALRVDVAQSRVIIGDRVMWCDRTLTGVVVCQWMGKVSGEIQCRVRSDDGQEWDATINELEVVK